MAGGASGRWSRLFVIGLEKHNIVSIKCTKTVYGSVFDQVKVTSGVYQKSISLEHRYEQLNNTEHGKCM